MAMNKDVLGKAIAEVITDSNAPASMKAQIEELWINISDEIIKHIKENAEVTVAAGIPVTTSTGAGATSSIGTGTITG